MNTIMMTILLVCDGPEKLKDFELGLGRHEDTAVTRIHAADQIIERITDRTRPIDLVVVDETVGGQPGLRWIETIVDANPMLNTALVSGLPDEDFHEYTEGLGVLLGLPKNPDAASADLAIEKLAKVLSLYQALGNKG